MIDKEANIITYSEAFSLSGNGFLHVGQNAGFFQTVNQNRRNNRAAGSGNKEWNDVSVKSNPGRTLPHEKHGYRVGAQAAKDGSAKDFAKQGAPPKSAT